VLNCSVNRVCEASRPMSRQEKVLYSVWLQKKFSQAGLRTIDGKPLSILSPGSRNETEGPDFSDAVVQIDDNILQGSIEIHWTGEDWYAHRHHLDPVYNTTILHVVAAAVQDLEIRRQDGKIIPTLVLVADRLEVIPEEYRCAQWPGLATESFRAIIENYAGLRFRRKCAALRDGLSRRGVEDVFFAGLCDVLGYSKNRQAFAALAQAVPVSLIYEITGSSTPHERLLNLESALLGLAGILTTERYLKQIESSKYLDGVRTRWKSLKRRYRLREIEGVNWHFAGSRPANHPTRRIAALAQMIVKVYPGHLAQFWLQRIASRQSFAEVEHWVSEIFQQPGGMWKNHPLFRFQPGRVLLGTNRLRDLWTNLLLPFAWAMAALQKQTDQMQRTREFAEMVPRGEIPAQVRRLLNRLSVPISELRRNDQIQGLIEYQKRFCDLKICNLCMFEKYVL